MDPFVAELSAKGLLDAESARRIDELETRAHVPLARELHALLYLGAVLILGGVGAAVKDHLDRIGPMAILALLGLAAGLCVAYCFQAGRPFSPKRVESPTVAFDYLLYLGIGLAGIFMGYLEVQTHWLGELWDVYLFLAGLAC